jgi:CRP-like cAMP-binding protein
MRGDDISAAWSGRLSCQTCGIRALALFADLAEDDFRLIHLPLEEMRVEPGTVLYHAGDPGAALFTLRHGLVKLVQYLPDGTQRIVRLLWTGATAGMEATLGVPYEHAAIALQPSLVCRIPKQVVDRLSHETPRLHGQLMQRWHDALHQADRWLSELSSGKAVQRMARLLLLLAASDGTVTLFSREELGAILAITTEHASRTIAELKKQHAILELAGNRFRCDLDLLACISAAEC